ncbi:MAG: DUF680 domain-containing protein [Mesorhizobium sp.]
MKKIALATAAVLTLTGAAFAENPNVGGQDINTIAQQQKLDSTYTSSVNTGSYEAGTKVIKPVTEGAPRLGGNS